MRAVDTEANCKWQPVTLMLRGGGRLECSCGALAVIIIGEVHPNDGYLGPIDPWCQGCYIKDQQKAYEDD